MHAGIRRLRVVCFALSVSALFVFLPLRPASAEAPPATGKNSKVQLSGVGWVTYRYQTSYSHLTGVHYVPSTITAGGQNSFDIDRVFFTADYTFTDRYSWESQIEIQNFSGNPKIFVKRAFVRMASPFGLTGTSVKFGQMSNVYTSVVQDAWGYRIVSKVPVDRYLGISTVWVGAGLDGKLLDGGLGFDLTVTNQRRYDAGTVASKYKTLQGRVTVVPLPGDPRLKGLALTGFAQTTPDAAPASKNRTTVYGGLLAYKVDRFTVAGEVDGRGIKTPADGGSTTRHSLYYGGFASVDLSSIPVAIFDRTRIFGRVDRFDPNTNSRSKDDGSTSIFAGVSHNYVTGLRGIVDLEWTDFDTSIPNPSTTTKDVTISARMEVSL